jgi:predicted lipopolysaccharide heptosyltransferase III
VIIRDQFNLPANIRRILIIQLGDIGDVVWSTPTFHCVKKAFPEATLAVLVREGMGSLLEADSSINGIFEIKSYPGNFFVRELKHTGLVMKLRHSRFDLLFELRSNDRGAFMGYLTGAPIRATLYHDDVSWWRNRLFTHLLIPPAPPEQRIYGAAEQSLRIIRGFGIETPIITPKLWVSDRTKASVKQILAEEGIAETFPWVTINPYSRWSYKEWGDEKWTSLIEWLCHKNNLGVAIIGAKDEHDRAEKLADAGSGKVFNLAGKTSLAELAGILSLSRLHIGVDSAAPHIAAAVGTATVTIYGPTDWRDWAPVGTSHRVVMTDRDCAPCYQKGCDGSEISRCLEELDTSSVIEVLKEVLMKDIQ